ncbi:hypothetical protein CTA1_7701 [Colletotrichum tanaceti]|uniref:Uncharacterized protein n=1 Tax=Colletotrichum tanaceti TaxID=1306861 RepID=A0A4U6WYA4_9PEZI|nr:hypothetical protein CTA1_7701 [Colletotrichum tanaceti]
MNSVSRGALRVTLDSALPIAGAVRATTALINLAELPLSTHYITGLVPRVTLHSTSWPWSEHLRQWKQLRHHHHHHHHQLHPSSSCTACQN